MKAFRGIPRSVWMLGLVSLFMDTSSEMIFSLLPIFLVVGLGASALSLGVIEGIAESTALITKVFSGVLSDWLGKRKALAVIGYGLAALTKPVFAMANSVGLVMTARFIDRIGKGIRGAPRDALIADVTTEEQRGAAFGLRQSMDTAGAFIGPSLAGLIMLATSNSFRSVFWVAVLPGILAVACLALGVEEPEHKRSEKKGRPIRLADVKLLGRAYWFIVAFGSIFTLARFSEAFILLRAQGVGVQASIVPFFMVLMNIVYTLSAYPVGVLSDKMGRMGMLTAGCFVLVASDVFFALSSGYVFVAVGAALWGLHNGLTQGIFSALVADTAPANIRGS
ncbi:MAG TPA: MFS transporter, partial [Desulfomonilia bacterium]|nr:MFS transporter [Desulfomonilia bacterium]